MKKAGPTHIWEVILNLSSQGKADHVFAQKESISLLARQPVDSAPGLLARIRALQVKVLDFNAMHGNKISAEELETFVASSINTCRKSGSETLMTILRDITEFHAGNFVYPDVETVASYLTNFIQKSAPADGKDPGFKSNVQALANAVSRGEGNERAGVFCHYLVQGRTCPEPKCTDKHGSICMPYLDGKCQQGEQCGFVHLETSRTSRRDRAPNGATSAQGPDRRQGVTRFDQDRQARASAAKTTPCPRLVKEGNCNFGEGKCWYSHEFVLVSAAVQKKKSGGETSEGEKKKDGTSAGVNNRVPGGKGERGKGKGNGRRGGKGGRGTEVAGRALNAGGKGSSGQEARTTNAANVVQVEAGVRVDVGVTQVVDVAPQVEDDNSGGDLFTSFMGTAGWSEEAKELHQDAHFRDKHGANAIVLDTAAATSIMFEGVLQNLKPMRNTVRVAPYAGDAIPVGREGVYFGIDNHGHMIYVPSVLAMEDRRCLNLLSWSQLSHVGYTLHGEQEVLTLFDASQQCCGLFVRYQNAYGRQYRGLYVLHMVTVPIDSPLGRGPWVEQRKAEFKKAMENPTNEGQRVWANLLQIGQKAEGALDVDLTSDSEDVEDEPPLVGVEEKEDATCPHQHLCWEEQSGTDIVAAAVKLAGDGDLGGQGDSVARALGDSLGDLSEVEKSGFPKAARFGERDPDWEVKSSVARENHITLETAHSRLCHAVPTRDILYLIKGGRLRGITIAKGEHTSGRCMHCIMANARRGKLAGHSVFPYTRPDLAMQAETEHKYHGPLCMAADGWGPSQITGTGGYSFISMFWVFPGPWGIAYPVKNKDSETTQRAFLKALALVEAEAGRRPKIVRTDNGTEYAGSFNAPSEGHQPIHHQQIPPYNQQMNPAENWKSVLNPLRAAFYT